MARRFTRVPGRLFLRSSEAGSCMNRPPKAPRMASAGPHEACRSPHLWRRMKMQGDVYPRPRMSGSDAPYCYGWGGPDDPDAPPSVTALKRDRTAHSRPVGSTKREHTQYPLLRHAGRRADCGTGVGMIRRLQVDLGGAGEADQRRGRPERHAHGHLGAVPVSSGIVRGHRSPPVNRRGTRCTCIRRETAPCSQKHAEDSGANFALTAFYEVGSLDVHVSTRSGLPCRG
jgi:hypothetical protein